MSNTRRHKDSDYPNTNINLEKGRLTNVVVVVMLTTKPYSTVALIIILTLLTLISLLNSTKPY